MHARPILAVVAAAWLAAGPVWPAEQAEFQPSPPYYASFFYPWFPNWSDRGHSPPKNWFSNYLPDLNPCAFDAATELYDSNDDATIYWQLAKMAEARLAVAISSWWGPLHKTDWTFRHILNDVMNRPENPYPNLRWALYYEKESLGDPSVIELVNDLNYIKSNYTSQRGYLKIGGRPVIFVYASGSDGAGMASRWWQARAETGFYVVLKVYGGYKADPNQPDNWHQYAPANRTDSQPPYSFMVSPGFWLDGEPPRLPRDISAFRQAVTAMVAAPVTWKLVETWNEWGEGTAVEPGDQVIQSATGPALPDPNGTPFKNLYVEALGELLPPLQQGAGAAVDASAPRLPANAVVNAASFQAGALSPGQLATLFGSNVGPANPSGAIVDATGLLQKSLSETRVLFDCVPGPLLYVQANQVNAVVPYAAGVNGYTQIQVEYKGRKTETRTLPMAAASPAIFTRDSSGKGQATILNQDTSVNSASNPAARGSVISLWATGEGLTEPAGIDGKLAGEVLPKPKLPVSVRVGGLEAQVLYAGGAPGLVAGVMQVNVRIPEAVLPGSAVPILLQVGGFSSPSGVTVAVQ